ncbi:MAG: GNAT family N-acetyltransferase, partial [Gammaproteobacteria bacterium]
MSSSIRIRQFQYPEDYEAVWKLWENIEQGVRVGRSDSPQEIQKKLQRDPDLFLVAAAGNEIIGTVIGGYDGRRGTIYHLAVAKQFRQQGIGARLMDEVESRLRAKGCVRCFLFVTVDNGEAERFYERRGWT